MFNPNAQNAKKAEKAAKKKAVTELKTLTESLIPQDIHDGMDVNSDFSYYFFLQLNWN